MKYCATSIKVDIPKPMIADRFNVTFRNKRAEKNPIGINIAKLPKKLMSVTKKYTGLNCSLTSFCRSRFADFT